MEITSVILKILSIDGKRLSSINEFINIVGKFASADCVILWELNPKTEYLSTVAHWFLQTAHYPSVHDLSKKDSITGDSIGIMRPLYVENVWTCDKVNKENGFWENYKLNSFFVLPIIFKDGNKGALNIYSKEINAFDNKIQDNIEILASIIPNWYRSVRNHVTFNLIEKIDEIIKKNETKFGNQKIIPSRDQMASLFDLICNEISTIFNCFETAIYLKDPFQSKEEYIRMASTWKPRESQSVYKADINDGLTGWILANKQAVKITDLLLFEKQKKFIRTEYAGITWHAKGDIKKAVSEKLGITDKNQKLPPMGFMGAPIMIGEEIFGVIRCCAALDGPYYFGSPELEMLSIIAARVSHTWKNFIQQNVIDEDAGVWENVVNKISELDKFVIDEIERDNPSIKSIFNKGLSVLSELIRDADITDVRLLDVNRENLVFVAMAGDAWDQGKDSKEIALRTAKKFSVIGNDSDSAGSKVFKTGDTLILDPIKKGDPYDETFSQTQKLIVAPLLIGKNVFGVLDVRSVNNRLFQNAAKSIVVLMGRQLALYYHLVQNILDHGKIRNEQLQTYQDFVHQVRSPIYQASARSRKALNAVINSLNRSVLLENLQATSGLCNKATRVAENISLFADLAKKNDVKINNLPLEVSTILRLLREIVDDNIIMTDPERNLRIETDKKSFNILNSLHVYLDHHMLEQSLNVLLDNAIKYSFDNTVINVYAELSNKNNFQIIVKNVGNQITQEEIILCKQRGYRSPLAIATTGEGGGIGLWVVDNIMKAQKGTLEIFATNEYHETHIKLIFLADKK